MNNPIHPCLPQNLRPFLMLAVILTLSGCSTPLVVNHPIGPNPYAAAGPAAYGQLQVFSLIEKEETVGFSSPYERRTAYDIYSINGKRLKHINDNNCGHFDSTPKTVALPAGTYLVRAFMADGLGQLAELTVGIKAGRRTEVHLDGKWRLSANYSPSQLVRAPNGLPIGWVADNRPR